MASKSLKRNERDWAGQLISWLKAAIEKKQTIFQDATNDTSVKMKSGKTKFPDILLFTDKTSGIIFNGWELKFPDTPVDDAEMLDNALEKAKKLKAESFVTWNGTQAVIWGINTKKYTINSLVKIKEYPKEKYISVREDLSDPNNYAKYEPLLKERAYLILHDLEQLYINKKLKPALDISGNIIEAVQNTANIIIPQFQKSIEEEKNKNASFRSEFNNWKIYESSTLRILSSSSRRSEHVIPEHVLATFTFYNLIGKVLFYLTLCENLSGELTKLSINKSQNLKRTLNKYFENAKKIDYQAIFQPYFTDCIEYSDTTENALFALISTLTDFDFKILPTEVIGNILENLVPKNEKQKFGQYFTPEILATLVAFPVVRTNSDFLFDPTCGTGTFLNSFYKILNFYGLDNHTSLLNQIWGNDISLFPAVLSVINLYKQDVTKVDNFPRITRNDYFNLKTGKTLFFPDSRNYKKQVSVKIPQFDGIASNFPFIQQEDIPNKILSNHFKEHFQKKQQAFLGNNNFKINERSDYFTYCIYNSTDFLKKGGRLSAITSNAWLGKEYGLQFKKFLLDNFHIKYIIQSKAEHWFTESQVSTIYFVLEKIKNNIPTKFITINFKLSDLFKGETTKEQIQKIEDFYTDIDMCDDKRNLNWKQDDFFSNLYTNNTNKTSVSIISKETLQDSIDKKTNWSEFFISPNIFEHFDNYLTDYCPRIFDVIRGERTGWNPMFIIKKDDKSKTGIDPKFLTPMIKSSSELSSILFSNNFSHYFFVCKEKYKNLNSSTKNWIDKFKNKPNKNGSKTISEANANHKPYWYSLQPKTANIITAINPYERFFFTYSQKPFVIDQRLIAMKTNNQFDAELITALLNSAITYLSLEMKGTSRNLGALDLNSTYLKKLRALNPDLLNEEQKQAIKKAFHAIEKRKVGTIFEEVKQPDRINFDKVVLRSFGINTKILDYIYSMLIESVYDRVNMKNR